MHSRTHSFVAISTALPILTWAGFAAAAVVFLFQLIPLVDIALKRWTKNEPLHTAAAVGLVGGGFYLFDPVLAGYAVASHTLHVALDLFAEPIQIALPFSERGFGRTVEWAEKTVLALCAIGVLMWLGWIANGV